MFKRNFWNFLEGRKRIKSEELNLKELEKLLLNIIFDKNDINFVYSSADGELSYDGRFSLKSGEAKKFIEYFIEHSVNQKINHEVFKGEKDEKHYVDLSVDFLMGNFGRRGYDNCPDSLAERKKVTIDYCNKRRKIK